MSISTVSLIRGRTEVEVQPSYLTTERIGLVFKLDPVTVWLKEEFGSRAFFPDADGVFNSQPIVALSGSLKVEGRPVDDLSPSPAAQTISVPTTPVSSPVVRSVVAHRCPGGQTISVKVVQAHISYSPSGKPTFEKIGQMFIEVGENTANVGFILSSAQAEFGTDHVLVTNDGLQLQSNNGTQGLKFWKALDRKIYAIPRENLRGSSSRKRSRGASPFPCDENISEKIDSLTTDITYIKERLDGILKITEETRVPISLHRVIEDAFRCKSCRNVIQLLFSSEYTSESNKGPSSQA